ncbi:MAG: GldG family protein [Lachnospiraceae bacterium]|nr:GldG family protein [Lachnospiraceae bacterium]
MEDKNIFSSVTASFKNRRFVGGAYQTVFAIFVIAAAVIVNLIFSSLNISVDITDDNKYSIHEETKQMLSEMKDDVTLYYLKVTNDDIEIFDKILGQFKKYGKKLNIVEKDPVLNPKFAKQYTDLDINSHSIIVVNEKTGKSKYIDYEELLVIEYGINYNTYQYEANVVGVDIEGQINSAIAYVSGAKMPKLYEVSGHGETALGTTAKESLTKSMITYDTVKTLQEDIPSDCDTLVINLPRFDFTKDEADKINEYLDNGGHLFINLDYESQSFANLTGLLEKYGLKLTQSLVTETDRNYYFGDYSSIIPIVYNTKYTSSVYEKDGLIMAPYSAGFLQDAEKKDSVTKTVLMASSASSLAKSIDNSNFREAEEGDEEGSFDLGVIVKDSSNNACIAAFASLGLFDQRLLSEPSFANYMFFSSVISTLANIDEIYVAVPSVSIVETSRLSLTEAEALTYGILLMLVIPIILIAIGVIILVVRNNDSRKKNMRAKEDRNEEKE